MEQIQANLEIEIKLKNDALKIKKEAGDGIQRVGIHFGDGKQNHRRLSQGNQEVGVGDGKLASCSGRRNRPKGGGKKPAYHRSKEIVSSLRRDGGSEDRFGRYYQKQAVVGARIDR